VVLGLAALATAYLLALRPDERRSAVPFLGGVAAMAVALLGPLAEWAEHAALSAHMAQHLLLTLVAPPLWLAGTPARLLRAVARAPVAGAVGHALTRPAAALGLASAALAVWHLPVFFEAALRHDALHALEHLTLLATAVLAWWPVMGCLPAWPRLAPPAGLLYLFVAMIAMSAVAAPITLADRVLYPFYERAGAAWPLSARADQELAGIVMWMGGTVGYLVAGTLLYFRWAAAEEREERGAGAPALPGRGPGGG
jgi:putative membrane protein